MVLVYIWVTMRVAEIIQEKILTSGPISFHDFMEMALYYPGLGYYTSPGDRTGLNGDFYTSPTLTSLFGEMIGRQMEEMWTFLDKKPFTIVEYGAGSGTLCEAILNYCKNNRSFYNKLNYVIIEKNNSLHLRKIKDPKLKRCDSILALSPINGCILANELVDNFPVHRVVMQQELMEVYVDYKDDFFEILRPASSALKEYLEEMGVFLPRGFRTEINLDAIKWLQEIGLALERGFVLTIDYGYAKGELYDSSRRNGTLVCYHKHAVNENIYSHVGEQDITSHVNFSALRHWGIKKGLDCCGFTDQAQFLLGLGLSDYLRKLETGKGKEQVANTANTSFSLYKLLVDMGKKFKVMIQQKGLGHPFLSGIRFSHRQV
ncbi:MAG TPA: SAM-dependent methyltransferase [Chitinophagaceae bacterium]|nr:SAM-dependent methyltransferase [Chitinophagaceae bacterium]